MRPVSRSSCEVRGPGTPDPGEIRKWLLETLWIRKYWGELPDGEGRKKGRDAWRRGENANEMRAQKEGQERDSQGEKERE